MTAQWVSTPCPAFEAVRYDVVTQICCVRFNTGREYCYGKVAIEDACEMTFSAQRGTFFNQVFKAKYQGVEIVSPSREGAPV